MIELEAQAKTVAPVTAADICQALRARYGSGWQVFYEVGDSTGTRVSRHADAVAVGIWPSTGHALVGFEVKVSRSDWLRELADVGKAHAIARYCHQWYVATLPGVVRPGELPAHWGLLLYDGNGRLSDSVKAPKQTPQPLTPEFVSALVRRAGEADEGRVTAAVNKARKEWEAEFERRVQREVVRQVGSSANDIARAQDMIAKLTEILGERVSEWELGELLPIIKAVRVSGAAATWSGMSRVVAEMETTADRIRDAFVENGFEMPARTKPKKLRRAA